MSQRGSDIAVGVAARVGAAVAASVTLLIIAFLLLQSAPALSNIGPVRMATDGSWHPTPDATGAFSLVAGVLGSVGVAMGAVLIAAPLGVLAAVCVNDFAPPSLRGALKGIVAVLAGIPSVVLGLWGLTALAPWIAHLRPPGQSLLTASIALAIMILPTITLASCAAFAATPDSISGGARALGLSRVAAFRLAVWPLARAGVGVGVVLGLTRALGETMVVVMVAGNVARIPLSPLDPVRTLTANIALEMGYAMGDHRSALFVSGALLTAVVGGLVLLAGRFQGGRAYA